MVFPYAQNLGGTVDTAVTVENPLEECRKIFERRQNARSADTMDEGFESFEHGGAVPMVEYQNVVRNRLLDVLSACGLKASAFESIDGHEVYMKLCMPHSGDVICHWAQHFQYRMPFHTSAYSDMQPAGGYRGFVPMANSSGRQVPAYTEFGLHIRDSLEPFRKVDEIRLLERCLDQWVNLPEMVEQGVITGFFPAAKYDNVRRLHDEWGSLWHLLRLPNNSYDDEIRNYFGEAIAYFFAWFAFYTQMLVPIALLGFLCFTTRFLLDVRCQAFVRIAFTVVLACWASVFNKLFRNRAARSNQAWGMKDYDSITLERPDYRFELEGTWELWRRRHFTYACVALSCLLFVGAVAALAQVRRRKLQEGHWWYERAGTLATVGLIKLASILWGKVAPRLVDMQNHRTQARWNDALIWTLSAVKLFVALLPCIQLAFLEKHTGLICQSGDSGDLGDVAWKLYGASGRWPAGIVPPDYSLVNGEMKAADGADFEWLRSYQFKNEAGQACIFGCYPVSCFRKTALTIQPFGGILDTLTNGEVYCHTNCKVGLQQNLALTYVAHVLCTVLFLVIPIGLARWEVWREMRKVQAQGGSGRRYSFLQLQAKCHAHAPYQYYSWGGSAVEDFLELAIGFALLTCFGIMLPAMSVFALLGHMVEYRLLAFRMTNVTCRPLPAGAEGIGSWERVFELISTAAIIINVGLAVFVKYPMREWEWPYQFCAFLVIEHFMLFLRAAMAGMIRDVPEDVRRIEDFNTDFKMKFARDPHANFPANEIHSMQNVDIACKIKPVANCGTRSSWMEGDRFDGALDPL